MPPCCQTNVGHKSKVVNPVLSPLRWISVHVVRGSGNRRQMRRSDGSCGIIWNLDRSLRPEYRSAFVPRKTGEKRNATPVLSTPRIRIWMVAVFVVFVSPANGQGNPSPVAVIPFQEGAQRHIFVKATIGSLRNLSVMIDTGSFNFTLSQRVYEQLKLPVVALAYQPRPDPRQTPTPVLMTSVPSIAFSGLEIKNVRALVVPLNSPRTMAIAHVRTDAVIGGDLFSRYVVELDYTNKVLRVYHPADYPEPQSGCKLPLSLYDQMYPLVHAQIIAEGGKLVDAVLLLDTGDQTPMLNKPFMASHPNLPVERLSSKVIEGQSDYGTVRFRTGHLLGIRLGACTISEPLVILREDPMGIGFGADGDIGLSVFRRFTTIFDYPAGLVVFQDTTKPTAR